MAGTVTGETVKGLLSGGESAGIGDAEPARVQDFCSRIVAANRDGSRGLQTRFSITADQLLLTGVGLMEIDCGDDRMAIAPQVTGVAVPGRITVAGLPKMPGTFEAISDPLRSSRDGMTVPALMLGVHSHCEVEKSIEKAVTSLVEVWDIMPHYAFIRALHLETGRITLACYVKGQLVWYDGASLESSIAKAPAKRVKMVVAEDIAKLFGWDGDDGYKVARLLAHMMCFNRDKGYLIRHAASMDHTAMSVMVGVAPALGWVSAARYSHASRIFGISLGSTDPCWQRELELSLPIPLGMTAKKGLPYLPVGFWVCGEPEDPKALSQLKTLSDWAMPIIDGMVESELIPDEWVRPYYAIVDSSSLALRDCGSYEHMFV